MRQSRHLLTREELAALIASSACIETRERLSLRETVARLLRQLTERIAGRRVS